MPGYPIAWDEKRPDLTRSSDACPYSIEEIGSYLGWCHYHFIPGEAPGVYESPRFLLVQTKARRTIWLWQATDPQCRPWWIIVGTGTSPFFGNKGEAFWRWMWADSQSLNQSADDYIENQWRELNKCTYDRDG